MGKYDFNFDLYEDNTLTWIARTVDSGAKILEFGAANGRLTKYLSKNKGCYVDIVEIDEESGMEAAQYANKAWIGTENGDIEKYQWLQTEDSYDYIIFADVLEHLVHPQEVLNRCKAVIRKSGKILVSVPNVSHNSIIIELMNDRFDYNPIGLLDNTHLRFFTRQSFARMAEQVGWAIVGERAKYIRVGENEIQYNYANVSKEVFKELIKRDSGNIYQYMFTLALSSEYLLGNFERSVCMDGYSHYYIEAQYDNEGEFDYKKSISRYINPTTGQVQTTISILPESKKGLLYLMNCNSVIYINKIAIRNKNKEERLVDSFAHNGQVIDGNYYFLQDKPKIELELQEDDEEILLDIKILKYDFEDELFLNLCRKISEHESQLKEIVETYEKVVAQKDREFKESVETYEKVVAQKDREFKESVETYEKVVAQKDKEFKESVENYERMIEQKMES